MGVLTYKGAVAEEGTGATGDVARWIEENNIPEGDAQEGAQLFAESGCTNCHLYLGSGVSNARRARSLRRRGRTRTRPG